MKIDSFPFAGLWCVFLLSIVFLMLSSSPVWSCAVPVFKYALAYWPPDPYEVIVFHRGSLSAEEQTLIDNLKKASWDADLLANVTVGTVDLAESPGEVMKKLWEAQQPEAELPWMVVKYPRFSMITKEVWSGRFTEANVKALLDSPVRKEIVRRILKGEVAPWVFLESGDSKKDKKAADLLETELKKISESLRIVVPELDAEQFSEDDLKVSFSVLSLSRTDPAEKVFVQMLLNSEWDLETFSEPMTFPIFGRGRALFALVGEGINEGNVEAACSFLVGWCSCQVKEQNPGVDLLMSVNWDDMINYDLLEQTTMLIEYSEPSATENESPRSLKRNILIAALVLVSVVVIVTCVILWQKKRRK